MARNANTNANTNIDWSNVSIDSLSDPIALKRLALHLKDQGDLNGAKAALVKAKKLAAASASSAAPSVSGPSKSDEAPGSKSNAAPASSAGRAVQPKKKRAEQPAVARAGVDSEAKATAASAAGDNDDDAAASGDNPKDDGEDDGEHDAELLALMGGSSSSATITYTDDDMLDEHLMVEFKQNSMDVPSNSTYLQKIKECKQNALNYKQQNDIGRATEWLRRAKQFDKVRRALEHIDDGLGLRINEDEEAWLEELNQADSDLVGEFVGLNDNDANTLDWDDIDDMDVEMIRDAVEAGVDLPSVDEATRRAKEKKALALELKQQGIVDGALAALAEGKRMEKLASKLEEVRRSLDSDDGDDGIDLEALLLDAGGGGGQKQATRTNGQSSTTTAGANPSTPQQQQSAEELKQEAIRLKSENKLAEATAVFRQYKEALRKETELAHAASVKQKIEDVRAELTVVQEQCRLWDYHQRFVDDSGEGTVQLVLWREYERQCHRAMASLRKGRGGAGAGAALTPRSRDGGLQRIVIGDSNSDEDSNDAITNFVEDNADPTDERLEVSILSVLHVDENATMKKILAKQMKERRKNKGESSKQPPHQQQPSSNSSLKVDVTIQLPPPPPAMEDNDGRSSASEGESSMIHLTYEPASTPSSSEEERGGGGEERSNYDFGPSQHVDLPRGKSRYAKTIVRRMGTKRVVISVYHVKVTPDEKKEKSRGGGWFSSWSTGSGTTGAPSDDDSSKGPTLLGKVVLELKPLLERNCIAGDYVLVSSTGREVGGIVRLCLRTGVPFVDRKTTRKAKDGVEDASKAKSVAKMAPYEVMTFSTGASRSS